MADADGQRGMIRHSAGEHAHDTLDDLVYDTMGALSRRAGQQIRTDSHIERLVARDSVDITGCRFRGLPLKDFDRQHLEGLCAWLMKKLHDKHLSSFMDWELPGPEV